MPTEIQIEVPEGCYGRVAPRFGLADKNFVDVGAGVIDPDYRGEVKVLLFNHGTEELKVTFFFFFSTVNLRLGFKHT